MKNADENELRSIASSPEETHVYNAADVSFMLDIIERLTRSVCERVSELSREINGVFLRSPLYHEQAREVSSGDGG